MEMVDSVDELKYFAINCGQEFPEFRNIGREDRLRFEQDHPELPLQEEGQSRGTDSSERGSVSPRVTDRLHDLRLLSSYWCSQYCSRLCSITLRDENVQEFDTRWDEISSSMTKIPSDDILESLYKIRIRESDQRKTVLELYDMEIHQNFTMQHYQKLKTMVKRSIHQKLRLPNFDARHGKIETGAVVKNRKGSSGVEGGKGVCY